MANEAMMTGLRLHASKVDGQWDMSRLRNDKPTESLSWVWWFLELLPLKRLRDRNSLSVTWCVWTPAWRPGFNFAFIGSHIEVKAGGFRMAKRFTLRCSSSMDTDPRPCFRRTTRNWSGARSLA